MNDFLEIHWGYSIWEKAANEIYDQVDIEFLDNVDLNIRTAEMNGCILASCFSQNGDVLSQWRAYANDGKGYAIGFKAKDITKLAVRPLKVLYNEKRQIKEIVAILKAIYDVENEKENKDKYGSDFFEACVRIAFDLAAFKNPAFSEEKEIRMIHILNFIKSNDSFKLIDVGGTSHGKSVDGEDIKFRMSDSLPIPYIDLNFTDDGNVNPIQEVILGPKNDSRESTISVFLETSNIGNVKVQRSVASYR